MMYLYLKALHIVFIVTWFAGLFYVVRLFIYNTEANSKAEPERSILQHQFSIMLKRLWFGITWPSAIITLVLGIWTMFEGKWDTLLLKEPGRWLQIKLILVFLLYVYHLTLHVIYKQEIKGIFKFSSQQLRIWNEVATIFLIIVVLTATLKQAAHGGDLLIGSAVLIIVLFSAVKIYKHFRKI